MSLKRSISETPLGGASKLSQITLPFTKLKTPKRPPDTPVKRTSLLIGNML